MRQRPFTLNWDSSEDSRGFSLVELLVALTLVGVIVATSQFYVLRMMNLFYEDVARTRVQANLRAVLDLLSTNIRQAGEQLGSHFPAIILTNGATGEGDVLTLRRSLLSNVMTLCVDAPAGSPILTVSAAAAVESVCNPALVSAQVAIWRDYRLAHGGSIQVFLYNQATHLGEFVTYSNETTDVDGSALTVTSSASSYPRITTAIYVLEEMRFSLAVADKTIQVQVNGNAALRDVAYDVSEFQVSLTMKSPLPSQDSLTELSAQTWQQIQAINITLVGMDHYKSKTITRTVSGSYFPRNVLSQPKS